MAVLKAKPYNRPELKASLLKLIVPARAEHGNLGCVLFESREEPGAFYVREAFKDKAVFYSHVAT